MCFHFQVTDNVGKKEVNRPKEGNSVNDRCKTELAKNNT